MQKELHEMTWGVVIRDSKFLNDCAQIAGLSRRPGGPKWSLPGLRRVTQAERAARFAASASSAVAQATTTSCMVR